MKEVSRMRSRRGVIAAVVALLLLGVLGLMPSGAQASATVGQWLPAFSEARAFDGAAPATEADSDKYPPAVSIAVLPDGNVVYWTGLDDTENLDGPIAASGGPPVQESRSRALDLGGYFSTGSTSATAIPASSWSDPAPVDGGRGDMFCADLRLLATGNAAGRVVVVGGTLWTNEDEAVTNDTPAEGLGRTELWGRKDTRLYNPTTNEWTPSDDMFNGRWYPALITLADGRLFVAGGVGRLLYNSSMAPGGAPSDEPLPVNVRATEYYDPATGEWTENTDPQGDISLPLFARLHLMPDGKVMYTTNGQVWGPFGEDIPSQLDWDHIRLFDPTTNKWADGGRSGLGTRNGAVDALLRLEPPYDTAKVLLAGGTLGSSPGSWFTNNLTEVITYKDGAATREIASGTMNNLRWYSSGVTLPTGEVVALSGANLDEVIFPGIEQAVRQAEIYNPATGTWTALASGARDRTYHNTAVLLKDGSILVGGHSPIVSGYGQDHQNMPIPLFANNFKDPSFEIFKPPYLFRGPRPSISSAPAAATRSAGSFLIDTPQAGSTKLQAVLSRLPSTTHVTDADARTVALDIDPVDADTIKVNLPSSGAVLPNGYYYLFLLNDADGSGPTPSVASIVKVTG